MDDPEWNEHYKYISNDDWDKLIKQSLKYWDELDDVIKNEDIPLETDTCPMHPYNFFQLNFVAGFNEVNGYTYEGYVSKWRERRREGFTQPHFMG